MHEFMQSAAMYYKYPINAQYKTVRILAYQQIHYLIMIIHSEQSPESAE